MGKLKLLFAGFALATIGVVGLGAPAQADDGTVSSENVWCC